MSTTNRKSTSKATKKAAAPARAKPRAKAQATPAKATAASRAAAAKKPPKAGGATARAPLAAKKPAAKTAAKTRGATSAPAIAPSPLARRAIFIDVENTSNETALGRAIDSLQIDRAAQPTEVYAVGNWRAVGQTTSRHLARLGATLVHSAPVTGVRDWSDLWIAVAAGRWIALAKPGDVLEIVSDDKAFEAVGDAAATAGVIFRRVLHRSQGGRAASAAAAEASSDEQTRRRRRRGGRGRRRSNGTGATAPREHAPRPESQRSEAPRRAEKRPERSQHAHGHAPAQRVPEPAAQSDAGDGAAAPDAHGASQEQILATIRRLTGGDPNRWVNLDVIATALKAEGFTRPPGSTRLVVRLRRMKDVEVQPSGMVRLVS